MSKKADNNQAELNIGMIGHVDHGKSSLVQAFSGKFPDTHSEEIRRGISIRLGYADCEFRLTKDKKYTTDKVKDSKLIRRISFVDAPGHEVLMATMLSGAAIMDAVVLVISATEQVPMPQTREHLAAMNIIDMEKLLVVQNKIELVSEEEAIKNYEDIQDFLDKEWKGDASKVPIIPISAIHKTNLDVVIEKIEENFKTPKRDPDVSPFMLIARSFDINKPGMEPKEMHGGVVGGSISQGSLEVGMEVEIRPGVNVNGKWKPIVTKISSLQSGFGELESALPGGLIGVGTELDPSMTKNDRLVGHVLGKPGELPPIYSSITFDGMFLDRIVGIKSEEDQKVPTLPKGSKIMINIGTAKTVGTIDKSSQKGNTGKFSVDLVLPVCAKEGTRLAISVLIDRRWRLIGYGTLLDGKSMAE